MKIAEAVKKYNLSEATIRNWYKMGYIQDKSNIAEEEIQQILKSKKSVRRNKKNAVENSICYHYLASENARLSLEKIVNFVKEEKIAMAAIMYYMIKRLLQQKWNVQIEEEWKLVFGEAYLEEKWKKRLDRMSLVFTKKDDFLGALYMSLISIGSRSENGIYYTPSKVVDSTLSHIAFDHYKYILDPACGSGNFLMKAFHKLKRSGKFTDEEILQRLHGMDIDPIAVFLCKVNLYYLSEKVNFLKIKIQVQDYLLWTDQKIAYDLIIGNPPWGSKYSETYRNKLKAYYPKQVYKYDSFALFIYQSLQRLQENGILAFVLPEAILNIAKHEGIRKEILAYQMTHLLEVGREFTEIVTGAVILKIKKVDRKDKLQYNDKKVYRTIFFNMPYHSFLVPSTCRIQNILDKMKRSKTYTLKNRARFALGIVTGNNEALLSDTPKAGFEPVITGKQLQPYFVDTKDICHYINFKPNELQQVAKEEFYRYSNKIVYKFIGKKLSFSYEPNGMLSLNSANVICLDTELNPYYIVAMLNSNIVQLYFNEYYRTHKVLRNHIESFPILELDKERSNQIILLSKEIIEQKKVYPNKNKIEEILMDALQLTEEEKSDIREVT